MGLEELIDEITYIKKELIELEEMFGCCKELDEETYDKTIGYYVSAYDNLAKLKDILREIDNKNRGLD